VLSHLAERLRQIVDDESVLVRNFDEVLRLLDSCQLTSRHTVATPVNWKPGQDVIIPTSVSDEDAKKKYPQGFKTLKPYLRTVAQPK